MNDQQATQRTLFAPQLPTWESLSLETQHAILDALAPMLLQALESEPTHRNKPQQESLS